MKDLQEIVAGYEAGKQAEERAVLATIVKVQGSTYRRPGARMLIRENGKTLGAISSGCLEADVVGRAKKIMASHEAITVTYDMTSPENDVWGLNLGCNGVIQILLEPLPLSARSTHIAFIAECMRSPRTGAIASIYRVDGELKVKVGSHLFLHDDGKIEEDVKNPTLCAALTEDCLAALRSRNSSVKEYRLTEGIVEAFIEVIRPPVPLVIVGAGSDSIPLARFAKELGWTVTVADHRPAFLTKERFPTADTLVLVRPEEFAERIQLKANSVVALMTHDFSHDLQLLRTVLAFPALYVGLLGPSKRTELLLEKLRETGFTPTQKQLARLHSPIGLNIGAESSEEIGLSILAEIQAFLNGRSGGFLRDHSGPIHDNS